MAHFALLDDDNQVIMVLAGRDEDDEQELTARTGQRYLKTSYNTLGGFHKAGGIPFRKNYAGIGYTYDAERDAFIPPRPYASWQLDEFSCLWQPPIDYPADYSDPGVDYRWDESTVSWRRDTPETAVEEV
jgi:hypothetical protein